MAIVATDEDPDQPTGSFPACAADALDPDAPAHPRTRCDLPASALTRGPELTWPPTSMALDACLACSAPPVVSEYG